MIAAPRVRCRCGDGSCMSCDDLGMAPDGAVVAIGTDGMRPVVWGVGDTEESAGMDAAQWLATADGDLDTDAIEALTYAVVSAEDAAVILAGDCSWPVRHRVAS